VVAQLDEGDGVEPTPARCCSATGAGKARGEERERAGPTPREKGWGKRNRPVTLKRKMGQARGIW
jgi:hypothetical protein